MRREGLVLAHPLVRVGACEDPGGRLVLERRERLSGILAQGHPAATLLDERADEGRYSYRVGRFGPAFSKAIGRSAPPSRSSPRSKKAPRAEAPERGEQCGERGALPAPSRGCRSSKGRSDTRNGYAPAGLVPAWQPGHQ